MLISNVFIHAFKSIRKLTLPLDKQITVLIGPNESGKSNILKAIESFNPELPLHKDLTCQYSEFYLEDKWVKATPAFNRELCERHHVAPLEFNGHEDSLFHPYNSENQKYMEYVGYYGSYEDIPVAEIVAAWERTYGKERVQSWKQMHLNETSSDLPDFDKEDVLKD